MMDHVQFSSFAVHAGSLFAAIAIGGQFAAHPIRKLTKRKIARPELPAEITDHV